MASHLDHAAIRSLTPAETAAHLHQRTEQLGWRTAWDSLLSQIRSGLLPSTLVHIFLAQCRDPEPVVEAMQQDWSALTRQTGIKHFGRWTRQDDSFVSVWAAVGDTAGLVQLLAAFSVSEVEQFCRALQRNCKDNGRQEARRRKLTRLYNSLISHPDASFPNPDRRPLSDFYHVLVPSCTSDVVLRSTTKKTKPKRSTVKAHLPVFQQACLDSIFAVPVPSEQLSVWAYVLDIDIEFAFTVLEKLSESPPHLKHNAGCVVWTLFLPLAKRLARRKEHAPVQARLYDLLFKCITIEPSIANTIRDNLFTPAVRAWRDCRSHNDIMDSRLARLISIAPAAHSRQPITVLLRQVHEQARFPLLRMIFQCNLDLQVDLDLGMKGTVQKMSDEKTKQWWPHETFRLLPRLTALQLFEGVQSGSVPGCFSEDHRYGSYVPEDPNSNDGDSTPDMEYFKAGLYARADRQDTGEGAWRGHTDRVIAERKTKAASAREATDREKWAQSAIKLSVATGSIDTFASTLQWARRFNKDPLVGHKLLSIDNEGTALLAGMPEWARFESIGGEAAVAERIIRGNEVVMHVLDTAAKLSHEPGFRSNKVANARVLPGDVFRERLARAESLISRKLVTDEWVIAHVWTPTVKMLIDAERFFLADGHQVLGHTHIEGLLAQEVYCSSRHIQWFIDSLAKQRDELWREHRARHRPATTTLPAPWPRGLSVSALLPVGTDDKTALLPDMPYFQGRLRAVVFASQASVMMAPPEDEEEKEAIGPFTDSYGYALRVWVGLSPRSEREHRVAEAWAHATTALTGDRMSSSEAARFWAGHFVMAGISEKLLPTTPYEDLRITALPATGDPSFPAEWNPQPAPRPARDLPKTCLDCMLQAAGWMSIYTWQAKPTMESTFSAATSRTLAAPTLWSDRYLLLLPVAERDAFTVAALGLLNARYGAKSSRLLKPYPSENAVRIPAVYLDEEFLEKQNKDLTQGSLRRESILTVISHLSASIPNDLLVDLARSLFERMDKDEREGRQDPEVRKVAVSIVHRIAAGDHPVTACEFVRLVVLERQDDSSWHRQVLDRAFLKDLPAKDAKAFFKDLALAIQQKLQEQRSRFREQKAVVASETTPSTEAANSGPVVKITTIKMIAQLLRWANFADRDFALEILTGLLRHSSHPDVVICIVEGLLQQKAESDDEIIKSKIVDIVAEHIVPLASSLDERNPLTEEAWCKLEAGEGDIPELYSADKEELPPLLGLLAAATEHAADADDSSEERRIWLERVIIPVIHLSAANHVRWTRLFLQRNGFSAAVVDVLPAVPPRISTLLGPFEAYTEHMPADTTDTVMRLLGVISFPPTALRNVIRRIKADKELRGTGGAKHFLQTWCADAMGWGKFAYPEGIRVLTTFLKTMGTSGVSRPREGQAGLTLAGLQQFLIRLSTAQIRRGQQSLLERIDMHLTTTPATTSVEDAQEYRRRWERNIRPVLREQLAATEALEAHVAKDPQDPGPRKANEDLPGCSQRYRLEIILHTHARHVGEDVDHAAVAACADALLAEVDVIIAAGHPHDDGGALTRVLHAAQGVYHGRHAVMLALRLGAVDEDGDNGGGEQATAGFLSAVMRRNMGVFLARSLLVHTARSSARKHDHSHADAEASARAEEEERALAGQVLALVLGAWAGSSSSYVQSQADAVFTQTYALTPGGGGLKWLVETLQGKNKELAETGEVKDEDVEVEEEWEEEEEAGAGDGLMDWTSSTFGGGRETTVVSGSRQRSFRQDAKSNERESQRSS
ncbi:hypothetical protein Micbo1qcDRAFT_235761 [Microdochium bolleyi]|uniref:Uncharacterized protein n=1 Tax=Microdochium bolleyi TaxID=196109 RepID=A0A136ITM5_9PEZI|nr:hypothetical protein Micbo1qcDRAFT_235761 [Microdochium bolleyi]